jgi:hypothetical protein
MATITCRGERQWRVQVRRKGHKPVYRTFDSYADAKKWADELEGRISGETYPTQRACGQPFFHK